MAPKLAGRWAWWNQYSRLPIERCIERAKAAQLDGMIIKYGYPEVERGFTAAGIPWATERYVYPRHPGQEATMLADAVDAGAVAAVINAEVEWERVGRTVMESLIGTFRVRHPTVELYASVDTRGSRLSLPYQQVLREHIAGWLPMVYPLAFRPARSPGYVAAAMRDSLDNRDFGGIPVLPTIQTYDSIGPEAVEEQLEEIARRGLAGYQAYTIRHATDEEWAEIVASAPKEKAMPEEKTSIGRFDAIQVAAYKGKVSPGPGRVLVALDIAQNCDRLLLRLGEGADIWDTLPVPVLTEQQERDLQAGVIRMGRNAEYQDLVNALKVCKGIEANV